jgi:hypothetical protein
VVTAAQNAVKQYLPVNSETALNMGEVPMGKLWMGDVIMDSKL